MLRKCRVNRLSNRDFKGLFGDREEKEWIDLAKTIQVMTEELNRKTGPNTDNNGGFKEIKGRGNRMEQNNNKQTTQKRNGKKHTSDHNDTVQITHMKNKQINKSKTTTTNDKDSHSAHYNDNKRKMANRKQSNNTELQIHILNKRKTKARTERKINSNTNDKGDNVTTRNRNTMMENRDNTRRSKRRKTFQTHGINAIKGWEMIDDHG